MRTVSLIFMALLVWSRGYAQSAGTRYIKVPQGYLMVLQPGDTVLKHLKQLAEKEHIPSAGFTGFGFAEVTFGFFDHRSKTYKPRHFKAGELSAMQGSIAWQSDTVSLHVHGVLADKAFKAHGGHILNAIVGKGTLEIMIVVYDQRLERRKNETLGANVLCLDCKK